MFYFYWQFILNWEVKMSVKLGIYRCKICGNIVQVIINGEGELICCGEEMELLSPYSHDGGIEKHVPVIHKNIDGTSTIKVGSVPHPMISEHHIMFIETLSEDRNRVYFEYLYPGMSPEITVSGDFVKAYEYCNVHGLWEGTYSDK